MHFFHSTGSKIFNFNTKWNVSYSSMFCNKKSKTDLHSRKMNIKMPGSERQMLHGVANTLDLDLKKKKIRSSEVEVGNYLGREQETLGEVGT